MTVHPAAMDCLYVYSVRPSLHRLAFRVGTEPSSWRFLPSPPPSPTPYIALGLDLQNKDFLNISVCCNCSNNKKEAKYNHYLQIYVFMYFLLKNMFLCFFVLKIMPLASETGLAPPDSLSWRLMARPPVWNC